MKRSGSPSHYILKRDSAFSKCTSAVMAMLLVLMLWPMGAFAEGDTATSDQQSSGQTVASQEEGTQSAVPQEGNTQTEVSQEGDVKTTTSQEEGTPENSEGTATSGNSELTSANPEDAVVLNSLALTSTEPTSTQNDDEGISVQAASDPFAVDYYGSTPDEYKGAPVIAYNDGFSTATTLGTPLHWTQTGTSSTPVRSRVDLNTNGSRLDNVTSVRIGLPCYNNNAAKPNAVGIVQKIVYKYVGEEEVVWNKNDDGMPGTLSRKLSGSVCYNWSMRADDGKSFEYAYVDVENAPEEVNNTSYTPCYVEGRPINPNYTGVASEHTFSTWQLAADDITWNQVASATAGFVYKPKAGTFALSSSGTNQSSTEYYNYDKPTRLGQITISNNTGLSSNGAVKIDCTTDSEDAVTRVQLGLPTTDSVDATVANIQSISWTYKGDTEIHTWTKGSGESVPWSDAGTRSVTMSASGGKTYASISATLEQWTQSAEGTYTSFYGTQEASNRTTFSQNHVKVSALDAEGNVTAILCEATAGGKVFLQEAMTVAPTIAKLTNAIVGRSGSFDIQLLDPSYEDNLAYSKGCVALILPNGITPTSVKQGYNGTSGLSIESAPTLRGSHAATTAEIAASGIKASMDKVGLTEATVYIYDLDQNATSYRPSSSNTNTIELTVNYFVDPLMPAFEASFSSMVYAGTNGVTSGEKMTALGVEGVQNTVVDPFNFSNSDKVWKCPNEGNFKILPREYLSVNNFAKKADGTYDTTAVLGGDFESDYKVTVSSTVADGSNNYIFIPVPKTGVNILVKDMNGSEVGTPLLAKETTKFDMMLNETPTDDGTSSDYESIEYRYLTRESDYSINKNTATEIFEAGGATASVTDTVMIAVKVTNQTSGSQFTITVPFTTPSDITTDTLSDNFQVMSYTAAAAEQDKFFLAQYSSGLLNIGYKNVSCNVDFDSRGGSGIASKTVYSYKKILAPYAPTRTGYDFAGWYTSEADAVEADDTKAFNFDNTFITEDTTLYAGWKAATYNLTYDYDGGTAPTTANPATYTYGVGITSFNDPTKVGYTFLGWYDADGYKEDGTTPEGKRVMTIATGDLGDKKLYAKWQINTYTLSFDTRLGTSAGTGSFDQPVKFGANPVTIGDPIREGFVFGGWFDNAEGTGTAVTLAAYVMPASDKTLYAKWNAASYDVTFEAAPAASGISFTGTDKQTVAFGFTLDNTITMTGPNKDYSFGGWSWGYNDFRGDCQSGTVTDLNGHKGMTVKGNITFTPIVSNISAYTLSASTGGTANAKITADGAKDVSLSNVTTKQSFSFAGSANTEAYGYANAITMTSTAAASGTHYKLSSVTVSDLYDHTVTLSYERSGTFKAGPTANYDVSYTYKANSELSLTIKASGYFFTEDFEGLTSLNVNYNFVEDPKADVHFKDLDGTTVIQTNTGKYAGDTVGDAPAAPTRDYYTFKEWNTQADGTGTAWSATLAVTDEQAKAGTIDFYPIYEPINYGIAYELAGGTAPAAGNPEDYNVETDSFTLNNPTKVGYTFAGWTGTGLTSATESVTVAKGSSGNRGYTATWAPATDTAYTVEHYQQNTNGTYSATPTNTDDKTGTTGTDTAAEAKDTTTGAYLGFTAGTITQTTIAANGSTVVRIYYTRNSYDVTFNANGHGIAPDGITGVKFGATFAAPTNPTAAGYTFGGWYSDAACTGSAWDFATNTMPASDKTLYAKWTENEVTISYVAQTGGSLSSYSEDVRSASGTPAGSFASPAAGYDFVGWYDGDTQVSVDANLTPSRNSVGIYEAKTYTARFTAQSGIAYTVKHYQQALDGSYPTEPTETDDMTGTTGEQTAAVAKSYTGFTAGTVTQTAIAGDGSTVVSINYARNTNATYTVHYVLQVDETITKPLQDDKHVADAPFGASCTETAPSIAGYKVDAATKQVTAGYDNNEITFVYTADFSAVEVAGFEATYDGQAHAVQVTGTQDGDTVELYAGDIKLAANSFTHVADSQAEVTVKVTRNGASWKSSPVAATLAKQPLSWDASGLSAAKKQDGNSAIPVAGTLKVSGEVSDGDAGLAYDALVGELTLNTEGRHPVAVTVVNASVTGDYAEPMGNITVEGIVSAPDAEYPAPDPVVDGDTTTIFRLIADEGTIAVPEALAGDTRYDTSAKIEAALQQDAKAKLSDSGTASFAVLDVKLLFSTDNGATWTVATEQNMPTAGITVLIPYPEGTNGDDYDFTVSHLVSSGANAGTIEDIKFEKTSTGLRCTFYSLSPVAVGYAKTPVAPDGNAPAARTTAPQKLAATGDPLAPAPLALSGLTALALACCGMAARRRKQR